MKAEAFKAWLGARFSPNTVNTQYSSAKRVEDFYGDLDGHYEGEGIEKLAQLLNYTSQDAKDGKPNPTKIPTGGNLYANLSGYKSAVRCYGRFRDSEDQIAAETAIEVAASNIIANKLDRQFDLEAQLQSALREELSQLETGLIAIDDGIERSVASGEIDILAQDQEGSLVVIELKRALARRDTIGQITGYMGDLLAEEPGQKVRGIIVAGAFDKSCLGAARVIPGLSLKKYRFQFAFDELDPSSAAGDPSGAM